MRGNQTAMIWKDERDVCILITSRDHQKKATFVKNMGKLKKPVTIEDYSWCMGYVYKD
jgi:hypothetical protein